MAEVTNANAEALLARLKEQDGPKLRIYVGAAPGVGKTYAMLRDAHALHARGIDVAIGLVETCGRMDTDAQVGDLEIMPRRRVEYHGAMLEEMDVDAILTRKPQMCLADELAHTNVPGSRNTKRYQDVLQILAAGIHVMTAVNIQHLETLNDAVARVTGIRVRETVPDTFLNRADEVINVDVTVEELRNLLREGRIYKAEKVEQALTHFFRATNLSTLRELALRAVPDEVGEKAASHRVREGLEPALLPERVMVCMSSNVLAPRVLRTGARIAGSCCGAARPSTSSWAPCEMRRCRWCRSKTPMREEADAISALSVYGLFAGLAARLNRFSCGNDNQRAAIACR
jgi:two-component system sensor histidine kinase KdpD